MNSDSSPDNVTLTTKSLWIPELGLKRRDYASLHKSNSRLSATVVDAAQKLLKQQFIAEGLQPSKTPWSEICPVSGPAVQIHADIEGKHCFTSCYRGPLKQVEAIYQNVVPDPLNNVVYVKDVKAPPEATNDCILYAIALAYEILSNGNPSCTFDNSKMREHLVKCFIARKITEFPKIS
ncbi:hypothetical protein XELAEV_18011802mg [Xenopus laevis]|uniref:Uncharacterized protein n=1 Tax=Xenopus laevis TaxID=8355 RepID=A0A974DNB1_XENLA|nr:hypothetical protein XELAEV_18011802mg [Xenopus laevis]